MGEIGVFYPRDASIHQATELSYRHLLNSIFYLALPPIFGIRERKSCRELCEQVDR